MILRLAVFGLPVHALVISSCPGGTCSLQELFDGGTISIGYDKLFRDWKLFVTESTVLGLPDYNLIEVIPLKDISFGPGLRYEAHGQWSINNGPGDDEIFSRFGYTVETLSAQRIIGHRLLLAAFAFGSGNSGGLINVFEIACRDSDCNDFVAAKTVFADQFAHDSVLSNAVSFNPQSELFIFNDITVFNDFADETVELMAFEQRFLQTIPLPEPSTWLLLGSGIVALFSYGWRQQKAAIDSLRGCLRRRL